MKLKQNKAITLIALVITIIILLILAGITIATLTGENGLLKKSIQATEKSEEARVEEEIRISINNFFVYAYNEEYNLENLENFLKSDLAGVIITERNAEKISLQYKQFLFEIDKEFNVKKIGKTSAQVIVEGEYSEKGWYLSDVDVKIKTIKEDYTIIYKINNGEDITKVEEADIPISENGSNVLFYQIKDEYDDVIKEDRLEIKIDKTIPDVTVNIGKFKEYVGNSISIGVNIAANNVSGINNEECLWVLNNQSKELGTSIENYTGGKIEELTSIAPDKSGTYFLHLLISNNAGNRIEYISEPIKILNKISLLKGENTYSNITGGWTSQIGTSGTGGFYYGTDSYTNGNYCLWAQRKGGLSTAYTIKQIDLTNVSYINCDWTYYADGGTNRYYLGISKDAVSADTEFDKYVYTESEEYKINELKTLDVSEFTGMYYIKLVAHRYSGTDYTNHLQINELFME